MYGPVGTRKVYEGSQLSKNQGVLTTYPYQYPCELKMFVSPPHFVWEMCVSQGTNKMWRTHTQTQTHRALYIQLESLPSLHTPPHTPMISMINDVSLTTSIPTQQCVTTIRPSARDSETNTHKHKLRPNLNLAVCLFMVWYVWFGSFGFVV